MRAPTRHDARRLGAAMICATGLAVGCTAAVERPDILLVTIDTLRADHCSAYGYGRPTTPRLEALARRGIQFESAYAPMATTAPAHATLFTGLLPLWHGLVKNGQVLGKDHRMLAAALQEAGYRTGAVVSSFALDRRFGLDPGFASYDDRFSGRSPTVNSGSWEGHVVDTPFDRRADETRERAVQWLSAHGYLQRSRPRGQPPFFLWVHLFDPHHPYDPPAEHREQFPPLGATQLDRQIAAYDGEIHFADAQIGALLDALAAAGALDRTLTVVTADHGEGLLQHGHMAHGLQLYEEAVKVPLVVHWPAGLPSPRRFTGPVQLADVAPTLAELAGVSWPQKPGQGKSLAAFLRGRGEPDAGREVFLQRRRYDERQVAGTMVAGEKYALRAGRWKYIEARDEGTFELFDLVSDPGEKLNLLPSAPPEAIALPGRLASWVKGAPALPPAPPVGEEAARRLRSLGYVQ